MDNRKEILDKIIKVYNKSVNNPSEEEAKIAVLKVQEMLAKYNLEWKDIVVEDKDDVQELSFGQKSRWWHGKLGIILAKNFKCKMYTLTGNGKKLVFVGKEIDVNICLKTFEYIKKCINYNCKEHLAKRKLRNKNNIRLAKESFIEGFIIGLGHELSNQVNTNQWGLILATPVEVDEFYNNKIFTGTVTYQRNDSNKTDVKAYSDGYIKGKEFNINPEKPILT